MASLIGALRVSLSADTAKFEQGMKRSQRQAASSSSAISKSLGLVKSGLAGFASALSVGMLASLIKGSLDAAGSLGEMSQQIGVSTRDLQTLRFAAGQMGVSQEELDKGLGKLTITLGQVAAGASAPTKALKAIGIEAKDLAGVDTGTAFKIIADGLSGVTDRAQRAAVEVALFGRTGAKLDTMLSGGSKALNELAMAAETLGIVLSDEQIQKADETADKLDAIQTVLKMQIAGVVADNSKAILDLANSFVYLVAEAGKAAAKMQAFYRTIAIGAARWASANPGLAKVAFGDNVPGILRAGASAIRGNAADLAPKPVAAPTRTGGAGVGQFLASGGGGGSKRAGPKDNSARDAERSRLDAIRDAFRFDEEMRRADMDILRAKESLSTDYTERSALAIQMLDLERASFAAEQANQVALGEITQAQAAQKQAKFDLVDGLERQKVLQDEENQRQETYNALEATSFQQQRELLEQQSGLAETAAERRVVELRILELALQEARDRQARLERESTDWQAIETGRRELAGMEQRQAGSVDGAKRSTRGPLEEYLSGVPDTAAKMEEALQGVKVNAIDGLVQGLSDAATGAAKLGDVFKNVAKQIIADLIRIQIQKAIVGALSKALGGFGGLFGGGGVASGNLGGSGSDMLSGGSGLFVPGFATGGGFNILGKRGRDKNIMSLNGLPIARVSHGERVSISNDNVNAAGGSAQRISIVPSPYFNVVVDQRAGAVAAPMAGRAAMVGAAGGQQAMSRKQRRSIP